MGEEATTGDSQVTLEARLRVDVVRMSGPTPSHWGIFSRWSQLLVRGCRFVLGLVWQESRGLEINS